MQPPHEHGALSCSCPDDHAAPHSPKQVNMDVEARFVQDMLRGDEVYEIRLRLKEHRAEAFPFKDDD